MVLTAKGEEIDDKFWIQLLCDTFQVAKPPLGKFSSVGGKPVWNLKTMKKREKEGILKWLTMKYLNWIDLFANSALLTFSPDAEPKLV